jgi:hypothetical protein
MPYQSIAQHSVIIKGAKTTKKLKISFTDERKFDMVSVAEILKTL